MVGKLAKKLQIKDAWKYEIAASLSQIGCIFLPARLMCKVHRGNKLNAEELALYRNYPQHSYGILSNIPHLEESAEMILQLKLFEHTSFSDASDEAICRLLLQGVVYFEEQTSLGLSSEEVLARMSNLYPPLLTEYIEEVDAEASKATEEIKVRDLEPGMVLAEDMVSDVGSVVLPKGTELSSTIILRLKSSWICGLKETVLISK